MALWKAKLLVKEISFGVTRGSTATNTDKTYESKVDHGMSVEDNADSLPSCIASVEKVESSEATTVEEKAARVYDVAALKYWGIGTKLNFQKELEDIKNMTREECVTYVRRYTTTRRSSCFSRGASVYRGVTRRQKDGRWQARIGRVAGNKDIYLGTFRTEEEAAEAYDIAAIKLCGTNVVTNFHISNYCEKGLGQLEDEGRVLGGISPSQLKL
ncbi:AP2 [Musa troglodytarum]|uniref:AP2 n=1 Tax=Musa troglodytarum TaxID=320322 RepID=A0A9E7KG23_9LILI|nr:AP2 [Musa troglodytarum]